MKQQANSTDIFNLRKMRRFFKKINPEDKDSLLVTIKIDDPKDRDIELILSRLSVLLPPGYIVPPATEAYQYSKYHFKIPHFHEMEKIQSKNHYVGIVYCRFPGINCKCYRFRILNIGVPEIEKQYPLVFRPRGYFRLKRVTKLLT